MYEEHTVYATEADAHREEGEARMMDGLVCHHGRPAGFSDYDVRWCGACEVEEQDEHREYEWQRFLADHDDTGRWGFPLGPNRWELRRPAVAAVADDLPF